MRGRQQKRIRWRCWIEVFIILAVLGLVFVNSLYLDGYHSTLFSYESGSLVLGSQGYVADKNTFHYTGDAESYVEISGAGTALDQMLVVFENGAQKDTQIEVYSKDEQGNMEGCSRAVWKKGASSVKINLEKENYFSYALEIPCEFTLSRVYYAVENGYHGLSRMTLVFGVFLLSIVLTTVFMRIDKVCDIVGRVDQEIQCQMWSFIRNGRNVGKQVACFLCIILVGMLASGLLVIASGHTFSSKLVALTILGCTVVAICILCYKTLVRRMELIGCLVILLTGSMYAFIEPPNVGISMDDEIHYLNAVQLSHLFDHQISMADMTVIYDYTEVALEKQNYNRDQQERYKELLNELQKSSYYTESGGTSFHHVMAAYIPSAIGLLLGRGLGLPFHIVLLVGRWMNVLLLAVLAYFSMKRLQTGKIVVVLIALIPTNIFIAGNYSYDTWLFAWSIFGLSTFFGEWQQPDKKIDSCALWLIGISMYLAVLPKQVYFPLTLIALFLPRAKFRNKRECWIYRGIVLTAAFLPFLTTYIESFVGSGIGQGDIRGGEAVDASLQMAYIQNNLLQVTGTFVRFLKEYLNPLVEGKEYLISMAYLEYAPVNSNFLLVVIVFGALVSREEDETKFPWWTKLGAILVYVVIGFVAAFSMYVTYTPVGAEEVLGCQGRYLLPALFPLLYILSRFSFQTRMKGWLKEVNIHIALMGILVAASVWTLWTRCVSLY